MVMMISKMVRKGQRVGMGWDSHVEKTNKQTKDKC